MLNILSVVLLLYLPTLLVCGAFYGAGRIVTQRHLSLVLRSSALFWLAVLWVGLTLSIIVTYTCGGNFLYGHTGCTLVANETANNITSFTLLGFVVAIGYGVLLAISAGVIEWWHRRRTAN